MKKSTKIIHWLVSTEALMIPRRIFAKAISHANAVLIFYSEPERSKVLNLARKVKSESDMLQSYNEAYQIYMAVKNTTKINGDIAEVGTYRGGSAKLICEAKGNKSLHLFDTFNGLPDLCSIDNPKRYHKGKCSASMEGVKNYLRRYSNVYIYKGLFPSTAESIKNKKFSFIHLDVDLYESTKASLEFFYPRMSPGGIIISHDYIQLTMGVKKAFDDFFRDKPEPIIEMSGSQCLIVKL